MEHQHIYDKQGKQICCSLEEKINKKTEHHSDDDGHDHDHSSEEKSTFQMFLPAIISFVLLLIAIGFDNYFTQSWFTGWVRITWYVLAYIPVGFPVLKEAFESIRKGDVFSEFLLMSIATIGAFAIAEFPEGVAVMLFYAIGEIFQTLAVQRAKANIKTLLDQRPDEVTVLENNVAKTIKASNAKIGDIIQLKAGEKLGLDGELLSDTASFNTAALTGESKPDTKAKGETVLAGMINLNSVCQVKVTVAYTDSKLSKIPEMKAGIVRLLSFLSLVFNIIASTTPICANDGGKANISIVSVFITAILFIAIGISPQCSPNITNTCQKVPISAPASIGLILESSIVNAPTAWAAHVVTGPIVRNVSGTITSNVQKGTRNVLTTSGITLVKNFSILAAKKTATITGTTLDV